MKLSSALIIFGVMLIVGAVLSGCKKQSAVSVASSSDRNAKLQINEKTYNIELARTPGEQEQGLSDREELGSDGMLFIFPEAKKTGFWMIDMKIDLDFIWIKDGVVTEITQNVKKPDPGQTSSQLPKYFPQEPVTMMLEVNEGFVQKEGIKVGDVVKLSRTYNE